VVAEVAAARRSLCPNIRWAAAAAASAANRLQQDRRKT